MTAIPRTSLDGASQRRTPVSFTNRQGLRLFGILHEPDGTRNDLGVILLSPGVKMRVGPERLYLTLTELFVGLGLPVLRFDFFGLGDSEGTLTEELLRDVYNHIEVGRFVDDTLDAMDWMQGQCGTKQFILSGLCGGAITGLLAGARQPERVAGLLGLGITPVLASRSADPASYMTVGQLDQMRRSYIRKLGSPAAWRRLLTLRSDYRVIWKALTKPLTKQIRPAPPTAPIAPGNDNASPLFPPAFFSMLSSRRPMLLIFGGSDRLHFEFEEKFLDRHRVRLSTLPDCWRVYTIEDANHVLSFRQWQVEMAEVSRRWLQDYFEPSLRQATQPTDETARAS